MGKLIAFVRIMLRVPHRIGGTLIDVARVLRISRESRGFWKRKPVLIVRTEDPELDFSVVPYFTLAFCPPHPGACLVFDKSYEVVKKAQTFVFDTVEERDYHFSRIDLKMRLLEKEIEKRSREWMRQHEIDES